jgi:hypothetical protein
MKQIKHSRLPKDISLAEIMWLLDASEQRIGQLVKSGIVERAGRGRYLLSSVPKFIGEGRKRGEGTDAYNKARTRFLQAKAQKAERERDVQTGEFLPSAQVQAVMNAIMVNFRVKLLAVPSKVAAIWSTLRTPVDAERAVRGFAYEVLDAIKATDMVIEGDEADEAAE